MLTAIRHHAAQVVSKRSLDELERSCACEHVQSLAGHQRLCRLHFHRSQVPTSSYPWTRHHPLAPCPRCCAATSCRSSVRRIARSYPPNQPSFINCQFCSRHRTPGTTGAAPAAPQNQCRGWKSRPIILSPPRFVPQPLTLCRPPSLASAAARTGWSCTPPNLPATNLWEET